MPEDNKDEIIVEVKKEDYENQISKGLTDDEVLEPGKHKFIRGGFRKRHPNFNPKETKLRINICIDADVIQHFRNRAKDPNAAPYQTQINAELRKVMERELDNETTGITKTAEKLLEDDEFLNALSEKLREKELQRA